MRQASIWNSNQQKHRLQKQNLTNRLIFLIRCMELIGWDLKIRCGKQLLRYWNQFQRRVIKFNQWLIMMSWLAWIASWRSTLIRRQTLRIWIWNLIASRKVLRTKIGWTGSTIRLRMIFNRSRTNTKQISMS